MYWAGYAIDDLEEVNIAVKPKFSQTKTMKLGDRGDNVKELQAVLIYEGLLKIKEPTGLFLGMTRKSVMDLQTKYKDEILTPVGLKSATGIVGSQTLKFLNKKYA